MRSPCSFGASAASARLVARDAPLQPTRASRDAAIFPTLTQVSHPAVHCGYQHPSPLPPRPALPQFCSRRPAELERPRARPFSPAACELKLGVRRKDTPVRCGAHLLRRWVAAQTGVNHNALRDWRAHLCAASHRRAVDCCHLHGRPCELTVFVGVCVAIWTAAAPTTGVDLACG